MTATTQNKTKAWIITLIIHALFFLFLFLFILKTPNPPFGAGQGVVLNLGYVDEGTGEIQTINPASDNPNTEEIKPSEVQNTEQTTSPEQNQDPNANENFVTGNEESDIKTDINTEKKETIITTKPTIETETKKENTATESKINTKNTTPGTEAKTNGTATEGGNNNGDKIGAVGDQGNPNGDINAKALYGNAGEGGGGGGKGGAALDMAGWKWEKMPKVNDENEDENGKLIFQITIDEQGEIVSIKTLQKTVSPTVEKLYKQEVEKLTFSKTDGKIPPSASTGTITFIIKSR